MLCHLVLILDVVLHPPRMCALLSGELNFVYVSVGPCFLLHLCTCTPKPSRVILGGLDRVLASSRVC